MAADKSTDVRVVGSELYLLPVTTRVPLKFGSETLTSVTCARVRLRVEGRDGRVATGWGETPLSVQWVWPANLAYADRHDALVHLCRQLTQAWTTTELWGHALEIGHAFTESVLPNVVRNFAPRHASVGDIPHLAALVSSSPFDIALHDAYGRLHGLPC